MCTVSWLYQADGYQLLCNRDEKRSRRQASPPRIEECGRCKVLAPRDGEAGGSWIAVNEWGIGLCLLNGPLLAGVRDRPVTSRGMFLLGLAGAASGDEVHERVFGADLTSVAPFTLALIVPGRPVALVDWTGAGQARLRAGDSSLPLTSSSLDAEGAQAKRRKLFERLTGEGRRVTANALYAFHESHGAGADAYSPCMHRTGAATVSFSWISVTSESVEFFYTPGAPCELRPGETTRIARRRQWGGQ